MASEPPSVAFVTTGTVEQRPDGWYSPLASVRRELILPAKALQQRGVATDIVGLPLRSANHVPPFLLGASRIVFGKLIRTTNETGDDRYRFASRSYLEVISRIAPDRRLAFCLSDDHFDATRFADFYRRAAPLSRTWLVPSPAMREKLLQRTSCPVVVYPEAVESKRGLPRVPRWGVRERLTTWIARKARFPLDPFRLKLLWFGHLSNAKSVVQTLPELRGLAGRIPLLLVCLTNPRTELDALATPPEQAADTPLRIVVAPWSLQSMQLAFEACEAVILPQDAHDPTKYAKSNNRMIDAMNAGRFVVAHPIPAYEALDSFAWIGSSIAQGVRWLVEHPREARKRLEAGQAYLSHAHSLQAAADAWHAALELDR